MSAVRHTPGPWIFYAAGCAAVPPYVRVAKYWPQAGAYQIIADCSHEVTGGTECEANARLIAAAPELLVALKEAIAFHDGEDNETLASWRSAIAKAEGRS